MSPKRMCFKIKILVLILFLTGSQAPLYLDLYSKNRKIPVTIIINMENIPNQKNTLITSLSGAISISCAKLTFFSSKYITKMVLIHRPVNRSWAKSFIIISQTFIPSPHKRYSEWIVAITKGMTNRVKMEKMTQTTINQAALFPCHLKNLLKCK